MSVRDSFLNQALVAVIAQRAASAPRAYSVTSMDDRRPPTTSNQRYGVSNATLEIRAQVNTERARGITKVASRSGSRARGASERDEVGADLQLVALVDTLTTSSWFDLERI